MTRGVGEVYVSGWSIPELKQEVKQWMLAEGISLVEEYETFLRGMLGKESRWGAPPKHFAVSFLQQTNGVTVHVAGWFMWGQNEIDFSKDAVMQGVPRREGWKIMERLWNRLKMFPPKPVAPPAASVAAAVQEIKRICPQCGRVLTDEVKFCPYCGRHVG
jgi:hypothetical protein